MKAIFSIHWVLVSAVWYFGNGILHDIFVIAAKRKEKYDREFLRLLMDGHVLMLSGAVLLVCYWMLLNKTYAAGIIGIIVAAGMLIYCAMIFPFLKSIGTIAISIILIIVSIIALNNIPEFQKLTQK